MKTTMRYPIRLIVIAISSLLMAPAWADNAAVTVNVDANAGKHPISPNIYGIAIAPDATTIADLNAPLNRYGGNTSSSYNWQANASNHANDWYFESIAEDTGGTAAGGMADNVVSVSHAGGAQPLITIPMLDWVAKVGSGRSKLASFSQAKYGNQTDADWQWFSDAGNGVLASTGQDVTGNDPNDASTPADVNFEKGWVQHLVAKWGNAASGGVKYYVLDNEHSIWQSTHRDVHPVGPTMDEIGKKMIDYGLMVKSVDPGAMVIGPEEWGWGGYFWSGYDQQYAAAHGWCCYPDRDAHGGKDYMPWLLDHLHQYDVAHGTKVLDVFTLHYYPQGGEFSNDTSTSMQQTRNRSTRSLWDPNYVDATWINDKIDLIPRMKNWVSANYPGLKIGITEYNWGAEGHINGATAQADVYGIFGREGVDFATRWTTPASNTPTYKAMKMFRNYDGSKHGFGDTSVSTLLPGTNADNVSAFGAVRGSDGAMTVMVVAKYLSGNTPVSIKLANFASGTSAQVWQLTSANTIAHLANLPVSASAVSTTLPAQSVTLFVVPSSGANAPPVAVAAAKPAGGIAPIKIGLKSAGSSDPDGTIASWRWDFGDGTHSTWANPSHTYTTKGTYNAKLTVTDNLGATGTASVAVTVTDGTGAINAPSTLAAKATSLGKVTLTWADNSFNEEGFAIQRKDPGSTTYVEVGRVAANTTTFVQTSVASGTYQYRIFAYNTTTGRQSPFSNTVSVNVP